MTAPGCKEATGRSTGSTQRPGPDFLHMFWSPDHAGSYGVQTRYEPCYRLWIVHLKASFVLFRAVGGTNLPLNDTLVHQSTGSIVQADSPIVKALELCPNSRYVKGALSFGDDYYWNRRMAKSSRICI
jgi:hypothetical protein